jgi:putative membrane protein
MEPANSMNEGILRDELARERTLLANERTLLAYVRTALSLAAAGAILLQFFPGYLSLFAIAWVLIAAGAVTMIVGIYRFLVVARKLHRNIE